MQVDVRDVLQLIRLYRHDLMNDLQLVHGYASMKKYDESMDKMNDLIAKLSDERRLQTLNAPRFVYWLILLKLEKRELTLEYEVNYSDQSMEEFDELLVSDGETLLNFLQRELGSLEGLHICLEIKYEDQWYIKYRIKGNDQLNRLKTENQSKFKMEFKDEETSFVFSYK